MTATTATTARSTTGWLTADDCGLEGLCAVVEVSTDPRDHPLADAVEQRVPVYGERARRRATTP